MKMINSISIIGSGNVAEHYREIMREKGFIVNMLCSRSDFLLEDLTGDLVVIAVKDDAIRNVCEKLQKMDFFSYSTDKILVHTSGFLSTECLKGVAQYYGSLYPVQSLRKGIAVDFSSLPLCIWANDDKITRTLKSFAMKLGNNVTIITDEQRKYLHLAAVFANNFTNHLLYLSKRILSQKNISYNILFSIIRHTFEAAMENDPFFVQTGVAIRGDEQVMKMHKLLMDEGEKSIYEAISNDIILRHKK